MSSPTATDLRHISVSVSFLPMRMDPTRAGSDADHFTIRGAARQKAKEPAVARESDAPQDTCVICLERITERAVAAPCNHLNFDFLCLASWLQEQPSCPLCKAGVAQVQYDWRSPTDFKTYVVPSRRDEDAAARTASARATFSRSSRPRTPTRPTNRRPPARAARRAQSPDTALAFRRRIYTQHLPSQHVGANRVSQFQNFTSSSFRASPELQSRARTFMRRELLVFSYLNDAAASNTEFLIEYILAVLRRIEIKDAAGAAQGLVAEFLGHADAGLFLHELESWLRSPYLRLEDWDRRVQYALPPAGAGPADVERARKSEEQTGRGAG
ncbi:hypothetical protein MBLNU459_g2632t1 [Dothideomycetes sp. NU459]